MVFFLLWHFVEVSYNGSNFRNFELFFPEFPSKRNPPHGTIDRSPVAGLRLSNASPPYIGHGIDGRSARVFLSFFFFRLPVQVQVKGYASFEGLPRLCGRPRDCRHAGSIGRRLVRSIPGCKNSSLNVAHQPIKLKLYQISLQIPRRVQMKGHTSFEGLPRLCSPARGLPTCTGSIGRRLGLIDTGVQKMLAHRRASTDRAETFPGHSSNPKDAWGRLLHTFIKIGSGREPGSFPSERKPTFPWPILTNKAPIESSGIQLCS